MFLSDCYNAAPSLRKRLKTPQQYDATIGHKLWSREQNATQIWRILQNI